MPVRIVWAIHVSILSARTVIRMWSSSLASSRLSLSSWFLLFFRFFIFRKRDHSELCGINFLIKKPKYQRFLWLKCLKRRLGLIISWMSKLQTFSKSQFLSLYFSFQSCSDSVVLLSFFFLNFPCSLMFPLSSSYKCLSIALWCTFISDFIVLFFLIVIASSIRCIW